MEELIREIGELKAMTEAAVRNTTRLLKEIEESAKIDMAVDLSHYLEAVKLAELIQKQTIKVVVMETELW